VPAIHQFDWDNTKDPFKPFVVAKPIPVNTPDIVKKAKSDALPIHSFDVDKFTLIGIITGGKQNRAMVTDPDKKGYVLREGMKIGKSDGVVKKINKDNVLVAEKYKDDKGKDKERIIPLTLPKKQ
jgi:type IV pilus assembly protein PilP